ncbi:hypothetical protein OG875_11710 [Streptomyces sp. NBC_01498]|uniref:hypothetical protein n=1 Tax=Streptomyces sp. NBC_01498 TaxID=2975870 RepID=UPI002E7ADF0E|nr:hypothetical protein [Streptomyces sp. NBC_01498]WTL25200.1 hypothetical protein OG875_11710 [Streptomyces sp. NBC_01498]
MSQTVPEKTTDDEKPAEGGEEEKREKADTAPEQRPPAWAARRDLIEHSPRNLAGNLVQGSQYGLTGGGVVHGNISFHMGGDHETLALSGEIPSDSLARMSVAFVEGAPFAEALARLRDERVLVLSGGDSTGRRAAALMLLHRLGAGPIRSIDSTTSPAAVRDLLSVPAGYLLANMAVSRTRPLRETHLLAMREQLIRRNGHLVITVAESATRLDLAHLSWEPPPIEEILAAHVQARRGTSGWAQVRKLAAVSGFLNQDHNPAEAADFARQLVAVLTGDATEEDLSAYGAESAQTQVESWFTDDTKHLRDKAFLLSLGVFDRAPYVLAAELADSLFLLLHAVEDPNRHQGVPVFGSSRAARLGLARARGYQETEVTAWGPVDQYMAAFKDDALPTRLLDTAWMLYPSARPALVAWLRELATDGRPLVRTRASAAAAVLTKSDLSSGLAHLVEPWAQGRSYATRLAAANTLTLAHLLKAPAIPEILHDWCVGEDENLRWTAIRAYGLLGPVLRDKALKALIAATREYCRTRDRATEPVEGELNDELLELVEAVQLLLLSARGPVLAELSRLADDDPSVRGPLLSAFLLACEQEDEEAASHPLVLEWYAGALGESGSQADQLTALWRLALNDRRHTDQALAIMADWVRHAEQAPAAEPVLARLVMDLARKPSEIRRLGHLLRTMPGGDGGPPPPVAGRLLTAVPRQTLGEENR